MSIQEYWAQVDQIEQLNPDEVLLPSLRSGLSRVNEAYLKAALQRMPDPPVEEEYEVPVDLETPADEPLQALWKIRTRLFGEMNKASNAFHECTTDDARAENSRRVLVIWSKILEAKSNISYYIAHKTLPDPEDGSDQLPDQPLALSKKLASLRARISQKKEQLRTIAALDEGTHGKQAKIDAAEQDLKKLKHLAGLAEQKIKAYEQDQG